MGASLVVGHGMDLVDDNRPHLAKDLAALLGRQQDEERLRRRDQNVWRLPQHRLPLPSHRISGADRGAYRRQCVSPALRKRRDLRQGSFQILVDVVAERLEGRDVKSVSPVRKGPFRCRADQFVQANQEGRQCLSRSGGRRDQHILPGADLRPALELGLGGAREHRVEPSGDKGMKLG
jgi:hypothetical protein